MILPRPHDGAPTPGEGARGRSSFALIGAGCRPTWRRRAPNFLWFSVQQAQHTQHTKQIQQNHNRALNELIQLIQRIDPAHRLLTKKTFFSIQLLEGKR